MSARLLKFPWVDRWKRKGEFRLDRAVVVIAPMHKRARCPTECKGCFYCEGGLFACVRCGGGRSETLSLNSRPEDRGVIENYSYEHGML